jgi:hypothetical protein
MNHDHAGNDQYQECSVYLPASSQRMADNGESAVMQLHPAVCQRTSDTGDKHEDFSGIAETVVTQRQPATDIVWYVVKKDEPQGVPSTSIQADIAVEC